MELITLYLKDTKVYHFIQVIEMWKEDRIKATPKIAAYIEKECGITRHDLQAKYSAAVRTREIELKNDNLYAEAMLAYVIYCIDNQLYSELAETLDVNALQ